MDVAFQALAVTHAGPAQRRRADDLEDDIPGGLEGGGCAWLRLAADGRPLGGDDHRAPVAERTLLDPVQGAAGWW